MITTFYLIRHGSTDSAGHVLTGRMKCVHLNDGGREQAGELPARFAGVPLSAIYATPLERTQETAQPLASAFGLSVQISEQMTEVDFGDWTGVHVKDLGNDPLWQRFNCFRSSTAIPGGESMLQIQARVTGFLTSLHQSYPDQHIALISHGDPIKTAVMHYLGIPLDFLFRVVIDPASVSVVQVTETDARVVTVNSRNVSLRHQLALH